MAKLKTNFIRSALFYVGDKYKLMPQLSAVFPKSINNYFKPFCGGGSSFLNIKAKQYFLNDIYKNIINLHKFFDEIFELINKYLFSCSFNGKISPKFLDDLIINLAKIAKIIVVTYNNTYTLNSTSNQNKITLNEVEKILLKYGNVANHEVFFKPFNSGKTDLKKTFKNYKENIYMQGDEING